MEAIQQQRWDAVVVELRRLLVEGVAPEEQPDMQALLESLLPRLEQEAQAPGGLPQAARWELKSLVERCLRALGFAARFRALRDQRGISIRELSVQTGIDRGYLYRLSRAAHAPPAPATLGKLAHALGVEPGALAPPASPRPPRGRELLSFTGAVQYVSLSEGEQALLDAVGKPLAEEVVRAVEEVSKLLVDRCRAAVADGLARQLASQDSVAVLRRFEGDGAIHRLVEVLAADTPELRALRLQAVARMADATETELRRMLACANGEGAAAQDR